MISLQDCLDHIGDGWPSTDFTNVLVLERKWNEGQNRYAVRVDRYHGAVTVEYYPGWYCFELNSSGKLAMESRVNNYGTREKIPVTVWFGESDEKLVDDWVCGKRK